LSEFKEKGEMRTKREETRRRIKLAMRDVSFYYVTISIIMFSRS